jgi:hypothetical protein
VLAEDPAGDRQTRLRLAEVLSGMGEYRRALETLDQILAREPRDPEARTRAREAREALTLSELPEEYRRIATASRLSRAELAALLCINVTVLARLPPGEPKVRWTSRARGPEITSPACSPSTSWTCSRTHTFQPGQAVRRGELARAVARVLDLAGVRFRPGSAPTDMAPANSAFDAAVRVVGTGLMELSAEAHSSPPGQ